MRKRARTSNEKSPRAVPADVSRPGRGSRDHWTLMRSLPKGALFGPPARGGGADRAAGIAVEDGLSGSHI